MVSQPQIDPGTSLHQEDTASYRGLHRITRLLFAITLIGQWLFVGYILAFYGGVVMVGDYERITEHLGHGVIAGDTMGNAMLAVHIGLAAIIMFGGPLQFISGLRRRFPVFHRWNGRTFFSTALLVALAGLYMINTRSPHGGLTGYLGNTLNASLIFLFSIAAWRTAMRRDFTAHRKWALRAFLMVGGVWFFRIGYGLWILLTGFTAPGMNVDLTGPFDVFLSFGHSLVPLAILEFYFYAKKHSNLRFRKRATAFFGLLCLLLVAGIGMMAMVFWLPVL